MAFGADMKLGSYSKIPTRITFTCQMLAALLSTIVQTGVLTWAFGNISNVCDSTQTDHFTCPQGRTNFVASMIWGGVGPERLYSIGKLYSGLLHMFWIGALLPVITWFIYRRYPNSWLKHVSWPLLIGGTANIPPATGINFTSWFAVGIIFNYVIHNRWRAWWSKYTYITSAALDASVALAGIFIFFCVSYPGATLKWWGNEVYSNTADGRGESYYKIPEAGTIGPQNW